MKRKMTGLAYEAAVVSIGEMPKRGKKNQRQQGHHWHGQRLRYPKAYHQHSKRNYQCCFRFYTKRIKKIKSHGNNDTNQGNQWFGECEPQAKIFLKKDRNQQTAKFKTG
jgi:hypothetical protein